MLFDNNNIAMNSVQEQNEEPNQDQFLQVSSSELHRNLHQINIQSSTNVLAVMNNASLESHEFDHFRQLERTNIQAEELNNGLNSDRDINPIPSPNANFSNRNSMPEPPTALESVGSYAVNEMAVNSQTDLPSVIELNSISEEDQRE